MTIQRSLIACAMFAASISAGYAGPCSQEIARLQAAIDAKIAAATAAGSSARECLRAPAIDQPSPCRDATGGESTGMVRGEEGTVLAIQQASPRRLRVRRVGRR